MLVAICFRLVPLLVISHLSCILLSSRTRAQPHYLQANIVGCPSTLLFDSDPNVIKLSSNTLLYQGITGFSTRFRQQGVRFGPTFDRAGLDAVRAVGINHQRG